jgi:multiple sugar transport system substrate-binding protein
VAGRWAGGCAVLFALACGAGGRDAATIELWALGREGEAVVPLVREFERREPGLRVRVQQIPWSAAHEKLLTAYVGDALPDVFQLGNTWVPEFVALRALEPLDERLDGSTAVRRDDYFPGALEAARVEERTWAIPWYADTRVLFYRADLLAEAGFAAPPRTWADWAGALERVARRAPGRSGLLLPLSEWELPVILALQHGATLLRDGDRFGDFQSSAFRAAMVLYLDLFERGVAPRTGGAQVANLYQDFARGDFAAFVSGPWSRGELLRRLPTGRQGAWATAPIPDLEEGRPGVSIAGGACLALRRGSPRRDAAWRLVEHLSSAESALALFASTGDLPPRASTWQAPALRGDPRVRAFRSQLERVRATPRIPEWERIAASIARHAESLVRGEARLDDALAALDDEADRVLEKRRWLLARQAHAEAP